MGGLGEYSLKDRMSIAFCLRSQGYGICNILLDDDLVLKGVARETVPVDCSSPVHPTRLYTIRFATNPSFRYRFSKQ